MRIGAKESRQVARAREKLEKQVKHEQSEMTAVALEKARKTIGGWLDRHKADRINLRTEREVSIFDENKNPATVQSKFINHLMQQLKAGAVPEPQNLKGRVTLPPSSSKSQ